MSHDLPALNGIRRSGQLSQLAMRLFLAGDKNDDKVLSVEDATIIFNNLDRNREHLGSIHLHLNSFSSMNPAPSRRLCGSGDRIGPQYIR